MKPDDGYIAYIVNPKSGAQSRKENGKQFENFLIKRGFKVNVTLTSCLQDACEIATDAAVDPDCAMVVVVGGDGTVREAAHGLEGSDTPLFIIPSGTENLLANELGYNPEIQHLVKTFQQGYSRQLDLGNVNGKCFTSVAGFGFDGAVVNKVNQQRTGHIDYFDYFWPIWRTFWNYHFPPMNVSVDGNEIFRGRALVFVGNISRYAIGLKILHDADYSDGLLDVCIYKCSSQLRLAKHAFLTILKQHIHSNDVIYTQGKNISVTADNPHIETEIDGDPGPKLPVEINVVPQAIKCILPKGAKPAGLRARFIRILK